MRILSWVALVLSAVCIVGKATAADSDYPNRPIRLIIPYPPGGSTDPTGRAFGQWFSEKLGQTVVVDNRPGAGSTLGTGMAAAATPDGYTLVLGTSGGLIVNPAFGTKLTYDPQKDFAPIGLGVYSPYLLLISTTVPVKTLNELVDLSKRKPRSLNFASPGVGTPNHLGMEIMNAQLKTTFVHVPYKGGGPAMVDLMGGRVQVLFAGIPQSLAPLKTNKVIAVATGHTERLKSYPNLPRVAELIPGFDNTTWFGILAPKGTPDPIVRRLNKLMQEAVANKEFTDYVSALGLIPSTNSPEEFAAMITSELARWRKIMADAGVRAK